VSRLADLPPIFGTRVAGTLLVGERPLDALWSDHGVAVAITGVALLVFVLALLAWRAERDARLFAVFAVVEAVLVFAVPILTRGSKVMRLVDDVYNVNGSRYLIAPVLILFSAVLVLVDRQRSTMRAPARRWLQGLVIAHSLALVVTSYALEGKRSQGPSWERTVRAAQETCRSGAEEASFMLISPGLYMQLDCDRVGTS
jgi:hypothetical protein